MLDRSQLTEMYYRMKLIRRFEEEAEEQYKRGNLPGFIHFYIGQEASAVEMCIRDSLYRRGVGSLAREGTGASD